MDFDVRVFTPLPERQPLFSARFEAAGSAVVEWSESLLGYEACSITGPDLGDQWGQRAAYLSGHISAYQPSAHIELSAGIHPVWDGRGSKPKRQRGEIVAVTGVGYYSLFKRAWIRNGDTVTRTREEALRRAIAQYVPLLSVDPDAFVRIGGQLAIGDYELTQVAAVIDAVTKQGDDNANPIICRVRGGRVVTLESLAQPSVPDYIVNLDDGMVDGWDEDEENIVTAAQLIYRVPGASSDSYYPRSDVLPNPYLADGVGFDNPVIIPGGVMTDTAARLFLRTFLRQHAEPAVSITLNVPFSVNLQRARGGSDPAYLIPPGKWVSVLGKGPYVLSRTHTHSGNATTRLELGTLDTDIDRYQRLFENDARRTAGLNTQTGGPER